MVAHIELAAEARVKKPTQPLQADESDSDEEDVISDRKRPGIELVDIGGGDNDGINDASEDVPLGEVSSFPLTDVRTTLSLCFQEAELAALDTKKTKTTSDMSLQALHTTYTSLLRQELHLDPNATTLSTHGFGTKASHMVALQRTNIELQKKQDA